MDWNSTSVSKDEYYHLLTMLTIKNDVTTLLALAPYIRDPYISLGMLPLLSQFCVSIRDYYDSRNIPVNLPSLSSFSFDDVRLKLKLFSDPYKKSIKQISMADSMHDEIFRSKLRFSFLSKMNMHYNLGIISDSNGNIVFNTQLLHYMFQDKKFSHAELSGENVKAFGYDIGTIIASVNQGLLDDLPSITPAISPTAFSFKYKDFNTNRTFNIFPLQKEGKASSLFLLHLLCSLNFARYVLNKLLPPSNIWLLRAKYITLYYAAASINHFAKKSSIPAINELNNPEIEPLLNSTFRSCMMHYAFINKGEYVINDQYLDLNTPFWGLIESCFNEMSYEELCIAVDQGINFIADKLEAILSIDTDSFKSF